MCSIDSRMSNSISWKNYYIITKFRRKTLNYIGVKNWLVIQDQIKRYTSYSNKILLLFKRNHSISLINYILEVYGFFMHFVWSGKSLSWIEKNRKKQRNRTRISKSSLWFLSMHLFHWFIHSKQMFWRRKSSLLKLHNNQVIVRKQM